MFAGLSGFCLRAGQRESEHSPLAGVCYSHVCSCGSISCLEHPPSQGGGGRRRETQAPSLSPLPPAFGSPYECVMMYLWCSLLTLQSNSLPYSNPALFSLLLESRLCGPWLSYLSSPHLTYLFQEGWQVLKWCCFITISLEHSWDAVRTKLLLVSVSGW